MMRAFTSYRDALNDNYDRYERLFKISRDITIESKRIIFQLHLVSTDASKETIMQEAKARLDKLIKYNFAQLAKELQGVSRYQYVRAYSAGVQEFVEAITFYHYLESSTMCPWRDILNQLVYPVISERETSEEVEKSANNGGELSESEVTRGTDTSVTEVAGGTETSVTEITPGSDPSVTEVTQGTDTSVTEVTQGTDTSVTEVTQGTDTSVTEVTQGTDSSVTEVPRVPLFIPDWDFILGVEDLSGELMRHSIKCVSNGKLEETFKVCDFLRNLYTSLLTLSHVNNREFYKKLSVMLQSLVKVENACHMIKLRGSEVPQDLLVHMIGTFNTNDDEGDTYE
ncbi:translin-associated protein X isoform X2 [Nilaparvata lugens]|nr:translin-associated protein X isoform X2 [Nilaparvata lugens]